MSFLEENRPSSLGTDAMHRIQDPEYMSQNHTATNTTCASPPLRRDRTRPGIKERSQSRDQHEADRVTSGTSSTSEIRSIAGISFLCSWMTISGDSICLPSLFVCCPPHSALITGSEPRGCATFSCYIFFFSHTRWAILDRPPYTFFPACDQQLQLKTQPTRLTNVSGGW